SWNTVHTPPRPEVHHFERVVSEGGHEQPLSGDIDGEVINPSSTPGSGMVWTNWSEGGAASEPPTTQAARNTTARITFRREMPIVSALLGESRNAVSARVSVTVPVLVLR